MSVTIKSKSDIQKLREAGRIAANALVHAGKVIHPGMTTKQLDKSIHDFIVGCGAVPTFLGYGGFPASACISINDVSVGCCVLLLGAWRYPSDRHSEHAFFRTKLRLK